MNQTQSLRHKRVVWSERTCSCLASWLEGLPCRHLIAVYVQRTPKFKLTAENFVQTFALVIPHFFITENYVRGYQLQVHRPILTHMEYADDVLPPCDASTGAHRGPTKLKRMLGAAERGWVAVGGVQANKNPYRKTKENIKANTLEGALLAEARKPERSLRNTSLPVEEEAEEEEAVEEPRRKKPRAEWVLRQSAAGGPPQEWEPMPYWPGLAAGTPYVPSHYPTRMPDQEEEEVEEAGEEP
jgi:hypothetical protein